MKIVAWQSCFLHGTSNRHRTIVPYAWSSCSSRYICPTPTRCKYDGRTKQRWCYYLEGQLPYWCLVNIVNEPLQPRQTSKVDNLTKKETDISVVLIHNKINNWLRLYLNWQCVYHNGSVINSSTRLGNNLCQYFNTDQVVYAPKLKGKHPGSHRFFYHTTCLASQYPRNKASGLNHTHLNTLNVIILFREEF